MIATYSYMSPLAAEAAPQNNGANVSATVDAGAAKVCGLAMWVTHGVRRSIDIRNASSQISSSIFRVRILKSPMNTLLLKPKRSASISNRTSRPKKKKGS